MVARLYDALHDPKRKDKLLVPTDTGNGGMTHAYFKAPKTPRICLPAATPSPNGRSITYGWLGRAPDYKAAFLATLGANAEFYAPYQDNARRWYKFSQERVPFVNHAIIHPPVDRDRPPNEVGDVCCHVEKETDAGIVVSGAKVVATGSVLTNYTFVAHHGLIPVQDKKFAVVFMVPTNAPGVKFICRTSYEMTSTAMGSRHSTIRCRAASTRTTRCSSWTRCWCPGRTSSSTATLRRPTTSSRVPASCRASWSTAARGWP